jgi:hypothetical protein
MTIARVFPLIILIEIFCMGVRPTTDPDMWWHLRTGELILTHGIPRHDTFSFTVPGREIVAHEWLSEAYMWIAYTIAGLRGVAIAYALLPALAFGLVYRCCDGRPYAAGALVALAAFTASPWNGAKPQLFNLVFLASFMLVLTRARRTARRTQLLALPLLTLVWANLHSGYLVGIVLLLVYVAGDAIDLALGRPPLLATSRRDVEVLLAVAFACLAAAALNPNGTRLVGYAIQTASTPAFREHIAEWRSPEFSRPPYWAFGVMLALTAVVFARAPRWPTATEVLLVLGGSAAGLTSARHIPLFVVLVTPTLARYVVMLLEHARGSALARALLFPSSRAGPIGPVILAGVVALAPFWSAAKLRDNSDVIASVYPVAAVDFLERTGLIEKHGYNPYDWGGYLIWRRVPVFIDGRADVYGAAFFEYNLKVALATPDWSTPLDEQGCVYALAKRDGPEATVLRTSTAWCERYADAIARIFVRCEVPLPENGAR